MKERVLITISIAGVDGKIGIKEMEKKMEKICDCLEDVIGKSDIDSTEVISDWRFR